MTPTQTVFRPGVNCYGTGRAKRAALLVDGDAYFKAFVQAALRARRSITILAWDFHSRTQLHHGIAGVPERLGDFLNFLVDRRRRLKVRVLIWDYPVLFAKGRELSPVYGLGWRPRRRIKVRYDDDYPVGASQHQKLVVIDGELAFCGGLDLTRSRWDSRAHRADDARRVNEGTSDPYPPFHDTMLAVDGEAAQLLDDLVRERWWRVTGRRIPSRRGILHRAGERMRLRLRRGLRRHAPRLSAVWPEELPVDLSNVHIAVARTVAPYGDGPAIHEVEALYLDLIASAKRTIYIENQYFTSHILGDALAARLREPHGPQIVAVLRLSTAGWLEAPIMGTLRTVVLHKLREADRYGRFSAYYPYIPDLPDGQYCDLHSKLLIVDDEHLLIGSANFSNRSMRLDTECVAVAEARGLPRLQEGIRKFRNGLLAEHLDVEPQAVEAALRKQGSLKNAIASLASEARTLKPYAQLEEPSPALVSLAINIADPEQPVTFESLVVQFASERRELGGWPRRRLLAAAIVVLLLLAGIWRYSPLAGWADVARVVHWAGLFSTQYWAPFLVMAAYTPASILLFPRPLITLFAVVAFGAGWGFVYAFCGILLAALATYVLGLRLDRSAVRRLAGRRLVRLSLVLRERGLLAMTAVRFVPLAPFPVVNLFAGAIRIPFWQFLLGSALGVLPGTLVATLFGQQLTRAAHDPHAFDFQLIGAAVLALLAGTWAVRRWLFRGI